MKEFDVIVIGGGHAGVEAAAAAARMGAATLLLTKSPDDLGALSCNPSIGGPGKSQLVAELGALGGIMPRAADMAGIHFRVLNASHGPATQALRAQIDRDKYRDAVKNLLGLYLPLLEGECRPKGDEGELPPICFADGPPQGGGDIVYPEIIYESVETLDIENKIINGKYRATAIVITTGTFLRGLVHRGCEKIESGRLQDDGTYQTADKNISATLERAGFKLLRLKTGTPARIYADSIDFSVCEAQPGDTNHPWFSSPPLEGCPKGGVVYPNFGPTNCYITRTTSETHQIIRDTITDAPMYNGEIVGTGPRYCPSLEDKVMRFPEHSSHQIFLEPETANGKLIYPNGLSTSMSAAVQDKFIRSVPSLENARIERYGYAIEYDAIDARVLKSTLESKDIPGLFFAGQINGTSGYEEAAAQGIVAGANAAAFVGAHTCALGRESRVPLKSAISMGGCAPLQIDRTNSYIGVLIDDITTLGVDEPYRMFTSRAEYRLSLRADNAITRLGPMAVAAGLITGEHYEKNIAEKAEIINQNDRFYAGYIARAQREIERYNRDKDIKIPMGFDYAAMSGLTNELKEKLSAARPETIAALSRIPGITPAGIINILRRVRRTNNG
ncbi:MAG: tRNA uridine-5-carboxymethylaminomethyl(34) synthesis enzyme MnmG [Alphaproteobacteria bacterium]|nr:tRNA uridine-5-carboxymethylaminomethyl(34) synthesis enzyme MnmG [Alphaproteobacteria bacterium]